MKPHYFNQEKPDQDDIFLNMAKGQGYVPQTCLLGGQTIMGLINEGKDPCEGCSCDKGICKERTTNH